MALRLYVAAFGVFVAAAPLSAATPAMPMPAPVEGPNALYCLRIEAVTGSRLETVRCWTRAEWAEQGVDVDQDWAEEGVSVIR